MFLDIRCQILGVLFRAQIVDVFAVVKVRIPVNTQFFDHLFCIEIEYGISSLFYGVDNGIELPDLILLYRKRRKDEENFLVQAVTVIQHLFKSLQGFVRQRLPFIGIDRFRLCCLGQCTLAGNVPLRSVLLVFKEPLAERNIPLNQPAVVFDDGKIVF